ncbi:MAG: hypothetical protein FJ276_05780 [Planctomycetes bacterium]|nr:hypothetical protein [Planctomycetota bacterium]
MYVSPTAAEVREVVIRVFRERGTVTEVEERMRIDDGKLTARCYRANGLFAMWLLPVDLLQFYDTDGNMLQTINLRVLIAGARRAA